jgi:hypothetical protein
MPAKPGPLRPHEERQNYSRREPAQPPPGEPELGDTFLIVTEGKVTEKMYFESVRETLQLTPVVLVVHPDRTDAVGLVCYAQSLYEKDKNGNRLALNVSSNHNIKSFDHVWVLFDTDACEKDGTLNRALELAAIEGIHVGHSTPCVEMWLLLHFRDRPGPMNSAETEKAVGEAWRSHYDKSAKTFSKLWSALRPNIQNAVSRATQTRDYHERAGTRFPQNPSTRLDLLLRALDASVQPQLRILH